jgi:hypothetical protein
LQRWGPSSAVDPYHVFVVPRPHHTEWMQRAHRQVSIEGTGAWVSVALVIARDKLPAVITPGALRVCVPALGAVLDDSSLEVVMSAVGERPVLQRLPAGGKTLPPAEWEQAHLQVNRVLLVMSFRRWAGSGADRRPAPLARWVMGAPPPPASSPLELLRLELALPPAVKQVAAEKMLRAAVRQSAGRLGLQVPPAGQLRQVVASEGSVFALLGVPKQEARGWLRSSGRGGLFIHPFWTSDDANLIKRTDFDICWLKSCKLDAGALWDALWEQPGFYGLVTNGKGLGLRVAPGASTEALMAQVQFAAKDDKAFVRRPVSGARWWRLGPLTDAEVWHAAELVASCGLEPLRGELRIGRAGPFRSVVYFTAVGDPSRRSLDDGSWGSSTATLSPAEPPPQRSSGSRQRPGPTLADPPPRRTSPSQAARPRGSGGSALAPQSSWAGARPAAPPAPLPAGQAKKPATPVGAIPFASAPVAAAAPAASAIKPFQARRSGRRGSKTPDAAVSWSAVAPGGDARSAPNVAPPVVAPFPGEAQLTALTAQVGQLLEEMRCLRRENAELRRQLEAARGVHQHQPYALSPLPPVPAFSPLRPAVPVRTRMAGELTPEPSDPNIDGMQDTVMPSPPVDADTKRARRSLAVELGDADAAVSGALGGHAE